MGLPRAGLGLVCLLLSCHLPCLVLAAERLLDMLSDVHCGPRDVSFTLPGGIEDTASEIAVLDNKDEAHSLKTDSACGLWLGPGRGNTMLVTATYDGCYIRKEDEDYVMTVITDRIVNGELDHYKKDIKCPFKPAMDAPSPSVCAAIQQSDRLLCANNSVSRDVCEGLGCCFSPSNYPLTCYFGNKVTAQCTGDGQVLVAISKDLTIPSLILDSAYVVNVDSTSCPGLSVSRTSSFVAFQFPLSCGGKQVSDNDVLYQNVFEATKQISSWQGVSITRDSTMSLTVQCGYSQSSAPMLMVAVATLPPPSPVSTTGPLFLEMRIAKDETYKPYYEDKDYPLIKVLRDSVFLEVHILRRTDPNLFLLLHNCWATPSSDPNHSLQWFLLVNGCPFTGEDGNYLTKVLTVETGVTYPNHYKRFVVSTFVFVNEIAQTAFSNEVYFHCSASVCIPSATNSCSSSCGSRKRRAVKEPLEEITVSKGPVEFIAMDRSRNVNAMSSEKQTPMKVHDLLDLEVLNETDAGFIGAEEGSIDGDLIATDKLIPRRVEGNPDGKANLLMWARGAAVGVGVLLVVVTILGVWRCHKSQRPTMHSVNI